MLRSLLVASVLCSACGPDFYSDHGGVPLTSSMKRQFVPWTPRHAIATGTPLQLDQAPQACLFSCPPPVYFNASVDGGVLRQTAASPVGSGRLVAAAEAEGSAVVTYVSVDGGMTDQLTVRVADPQDIALSDPLLFSKDVFPDYIGFDGGTWPDVGRGSVVMGPNGKLFLEVLLLDDAGVWLGMSPGLLDAGTAASSWVVRPAGMQVDVQSPASGAATFHVGYGDAGFSRSFDVRVAPVEEAVLHALLVQRINGRRYVVKADVRTLDGGPFLEPELVWEPDPGFVEFDHGLRPRRDVKVFDFNALDAGAFDAGVTVRLSSQRARVELQPVVTEEEVTVPPAPEPTGCGCSSASGPLLLALVALWRRLRGRRIA